MEFQSPQTFFQNANWPTSRLTEWTQNSAVKRLQQRRLIILSTKLQQNTICAWEGVSHTWSNVLNVQQIRYSQQQQQQQQHNWNVSSCIAMLKSVRIEGDFWHFCWVEQSADCWIWLARYDFLLVFYSDTKSR